MAVAVTTSEAERKNSGLISSIGGAALFFAGLIVLYFVIMGLSSAVRAAVVVAVIVALVLAAHYGMGGRIRKVQ